MRLMFLGLGEDEIYFRVMFLSLCARPGKWQLGWNDCKLASEEPETFDSFLTFSTGLGHAIWETLLRVKVVKIGQNSFVKKARLGFDILTENAVKSFSYIRSLLEGPAAM